MLPEPFFWLPEYGTWGSAQLPFPQPAAWKTVCDWSGLDRGVGGGVSKPIRVVSAAAGASCCRHQASGLAAPAARLGAGDGSGCRAALDCCSPRAGCVCVCLTKRGGCPGG